MAPSPRSWALRRGWWLLLVIPVAAVLLVGSGDDSADARYEASTLVVARQLAIDVEQLPALVESVFSGASVSGQLADAAAEVTGDADAAARVDVEPVLGTIAVRVVAHDRAARTASAMANTASEILVGELNEAGPGVGVFAIQDPARSPTTPVDDGSTAWSFVVPALAGLLLAVLIMELWLAIRRPIVNGADVERVLGTELLAEIALPRGARDPDAIDPVKVIGLEALSRRLLPGAGVAALVSGRRDAGVRRILTVLVGNVTARRIPTRALHAAEGISTDDWPAGEQAVIVDLADGIDAPQVLPENARIAALVVSGTPAARARRLALPFHAGELSGVVLVRRPSRLRRLRRHRRPLAVVEPAPVGVAPADASASPAPAGGDGAGAEALRARRRS